MIRSCADHLPLSSHRPPHRCNASVACWQGKSWKIKPLPIALPHETDLKNFGTLGYSTVRQAPNGVIHILSTMT